MMTSHSQPSSRVLDHDSLFARVHKGHTLITGNSRLSRVLKGQYGQWRMKRGDHQWRSPDILSWNGWLDRGWETASLQAVAGTRATLPGNRQLISLWESILRQGTDAPYLLHPESLAGQLLDTRTLLKNWQLDVTDPAWIGDGNENHSAFSRWNQAFEKRCLKDQWVAPEDRSRLLCRAISEGHFELDETIDLLGFDEINPAQSELLSTLINTGSTVNRLTLAARTGQAVLWRSRDSNNELHQMACWVRYWYEKETESTIAIVVPDLHSRRQDVERHLAQALTPDTGSPAQPVSPWNISMGAPLLREPLIRTAFDLLKLLENRIDIQDIGRVLSSPWLSGGISERNSRALLEKCLRAKYPRQLKLTEVRYRSNEIKRHDHQHKELPQDQQEPQAWNSPKLSAVLERLLQFQNSNRNARAPSHWAESLDQLLASLGWPLKEESRSADPAKQHDRNWQALQSWREGLRELASLDATLPSLSCLAAVNQLQKICQSRIFQPLSSPARIQVLGLYEISGLRFDHLWVLGLHQDNWPPSATPNPFIPGRLQRQAQLPHSSPQRELEVARTITRRLLETAPDCVFSYPTQLEGELVLPSPLLNTAGLEEVTSLPAWQGEYWQSSIAKAEKPQSIPIAGPGQLNGNRAKGGSSILKHQALCPFRAFASNRLAAESLETPASGISAMLHGSLIHRVLEYFWTDIQTQAALLKLDDESLGSSVRGQVERVVNEEVFLQQRPAFSGVEADRLYRQAMVYLNLEKTRDSFEVLGFEQQILPVIEGQTIRLVIDRVDLLPSGKKAIIDYKTGKVDPRKWFGDRPEDPQLPLYAISADKTPGAVVFAVIRDEGCGYNGVVSQEGLFPDLPPRATRYTRELIDAGLEMPNTIRNWRKVIHHLMAAFLAGEAEIDPKNGRKTCNGSFCELQSLCRISELEKFQKASDTNVSPGTSI